MKIYFNFRFMVITIELMELEMLPKLKWMLLLLKAFTIFIFLSHITVHLLVLI
jgi:hypothetical protein